MNNQEWINKRILAIIGYFSENFFKNKKILDIGAGHGAFSLAFSNLGANVTAVDARKQHLDMIYHKDPKIKCIQMDLDQQWPFGHGEFDLTLHMSTLNHLMNVEKHLSMVCSSSKFLVLDTQVCDSFDPSKCLLLKENKSNQNQSFNGTGSRPTPTFIERILNSSGMEFERIIDDRCNGNKFVYDWAAKDSSHIQEGMSRIWFCKHHSIDQRIEKQAETIVPSINLQNNFVTIKPEAVLEPKPILTTRLENTDNQNKRVAICFSGHLRSIQKTCDNLIDKLIIPNDCDVFISTWDQVGFDPVRGDHDTVNTSTYDILDFIETKLKPKKMLIEPARTFDGDKYLTRKRDCVRNVNNVLGMYYKIKSSNDLKIEYEKENNFEYDMVIRCRTDLMMERQHFIKGFETKYLYMCKDFRWTGENDKIAWGSSRVMNVYSTVYDYIEQYYNAGCVFHSETLLRYHVNYFILPATHIEIPYLLVRANGTTLRI